MPQIGQIRAVTMNYSRYRYYRLLLVSGVIMLSLWLLPKYLLKSGTLLPYKRFKGWDFFPRKTYSNESNDTHKEGMIEFAKRMGKDGRPVAIAIANNAYVNLAHSWLCNTMFMGIHDQIMIIVPDALSMQQLKQKWPNVHVFQIATALGNITGARDYTTVGFQRITYFRACVVKKILENHIDVFVFEFDAVWFKNPIPDFREQLGTADIAAVKVTGFSHQVAIGLLYIRSTNRTIAVWTEIKSKLDDLLKQFETAMNNKLVSEGLNDQLFLEGMIRQKYANIQLVHMSNREYADGKWYTDSNRNPSPVLINNNWIIGTDKKVERAIKFKHWFWDMATNQCDVDLVKETLKIR